MHKSQWDVAHIEEANLYTYSNLPNILINKSGSPQGIGKIWRGGTEERPFQRKERQ
jgi:hypothetical protein